MFVERQNAYPDNSHVYMYLLNNMSSGGICIDQSGPKTFCWSIRSHRGDWRQGGAAAFGWEQSHPLIPRIIGGKQRGILPPNSYSFVRTDKNNVVLSCLKAAEANGSGLILRFHELLGKETAVRAALRFLQQSGATIASANETTLLEDDLPISAQGEQPDQLAFTIRPFGVKTLRVRLAGAALPGRVAELKAEPVADMQVDLAWQEATAGAGVSHYRIYRGDRPDFSPGLGTFAAQSTAPVSRTAPWCMAAGGRATRSSPTQPTIIASPPWTAGTARGRPPLPCGRRRLPRESDICRRPKCRG